MAAIDIMSVKPLRLGAIADPMFDDGGDALRGDALGPLLEPFDIGTREARHRVGVGPEGRRKARPARFGGKVSLGRQGHVDANGAIFGAGDIAEATHDGRVVQRCKAEHIGPERKAAAGRTGPQGRLKMVARVSANRCWNAEASGLRQFLYRIILRRQLGRRHYEAGDEAGYLAIPHKAGGRGLVIGLSGEADRRSWRRQRSVQHQTSFFRERHTRQQILDPLIDRDMLVLIRIKPTIMIEVAPA